MKINKSYKFRLYPSIEQEQMIIKTLGCNRFVYNYYLDKQIKLYEKNKKILTVKECLEDFKILVKNNDFLLNVDQSPLRASIFSMVDNFRNNLKLGKYPRFRSKHRKESYKTNYFVYNYYGENIKVDLINHTISITNLDNVKLKGYNDLKEIGKILFVYIMKDLTDKFYAIVVTEEIVENKSIDYSKIVGIDVGIKDLVITSDFKKYENDKQIVKYEKKIKLFQKRLSNKIYGSKNYYKMRKKLDILFDKLRCSRRFWVHNITRELVNNYDVIVVEDLNVNDMVRDKNNGFNKCLYDASLSEIINQLEYKTKWSGKKLIKVNKYFPSSQICSNCGFRNNKLKDLNIREYECPNCHKNLDRDFNASINIRNEGIRILKLKENE